MSLQSQCRLAIRKAVGRHRLHRLHSLDIPPVLIEYLMYRDIPEVNNTIRATEYELSQCAYM